MAEGQQKENGDHDHRAQLIHLINSTAANVSAHHSIFSLLVLVSL